MSTKGERKGQVGNLPYMSIYKGEQNNTYPNPKKPLCHSYLSLKNGGSIPKNKHKFLPTHQKNPSLIHSNPQKFSLMCKPTPN